MATDPVLAVLLVDDETPILEAMANLVARAGFDTICATSGAEALQRLKERQFACMITDLHMPVMSGFELALEARAAAPGMLIVLCTGDVPAMVREEAAAAGIGKVLHKPLGFPAIVKMLREEI